MKWSEFFTSSIGKKFTMALTGLFLICFLVIHVGVNACIFACDGGEMFNKAAHFMGSMVLIRILEIGLFAGFFIHIIQGLALEIQNRKKRPVAYAVPMGNRGSKWYSRSMGLLGTILLLFLLLHWYQFWLPGRNIIGEVPPVTYDGKEMHNMFALMQINFAQLWVVVFYVIACLSLCYHLLHGFQSSFRTVGLHNNKYMKMAQVVGVWFSIIVSIGFISMPIAVHFGLVK